MNSSLITASQVLSQSVAAMANSAALVSALHDSMLAEVRGLLEREQALASELAKTKARLEATQKELECMKAEPAEIPEPADAVSSIGFGDDIPG